MPSIALALVAFVVMEPVTWAVHRFVMHGFALRWHQSHHRSFHARSGERGRLEANDRFPVVFAAVVGALLVAGYRVDGWSWLVAVGWGITAYGAAYAFVHDVYIHRRLVPGFPRVGALDRLAAAHAVHHRTGGEPYGMLLPMVPRGDAATIASPAPQR